MCIRDSFYRTSSELHLLSGHNFMIKVALPHHTAACKPSRLRKVYQLFAYNRENRIPSTQCLSIEHSMPTVASVRIQLYLSHATPHVQSSNHGIVVGQYSEQTKIYNFISSKAVSCSWILQIMYCVPVSYTHLDVYKRQLHLESNP